MSDSTSTPRRMTPGDDMHLTLLMTPHGLNFVTGQDRQHLLAFGRAAFEAGKVAAAAQQGAQDAEPAAWVATFKPEGLLALHSVVGANLEELKQSVPGNSVFRPLYTHPTRQGMDARQWLQQHDFEALERFAETSEDDESYDIGKEAIQRLTHFGCLNSHGFGRYSITAFGSYVLDNWSLARELPFKMQSERDAEYRAAIAAQAKQGGV